MNLFLYAIEKILTIDKNIHFPREQMKTILTYLFLRKFKTSDEETILLR